MIFSGDWHGKFDYIKELIIKLDIQNDDIIQVGDFGVGFNFDDLTKLHVFNYFLAHRNLHVYAIRGNHDDPRYFMGRYMNIFSNLHLVPDYTLLEIQGHKIFCVGGAISIDRLRMKREMEKEESAGTLPIYFENEKFVLNTDRLDYFKNVGIDVVVTHTAPSYCLPYTKGSYDESDTKLPEELIRERADCAILMDILLETNPIEKHFYGHFHKTFITEDRGVTHYCLNINELKEVY